MKKHTISDMSEHLSIILSKMCELVDVSPNTINFKKEGWFSEHGWTMEKQDEFKKWLIDYLYNNTEARKELLTSPSKNKKTIERAVDHFIFAYGWTTKEK